MLLKAKEEKNILHIRTRRKGNCIGHILRRICLLKHVIQGKLDGKTYGRGRRRRRGNQIFSGLKERKR
jgi:hypothetical protein